MSKWLFIRSYLVIVLFILLVGLGLDRIMTYYASKDNITIEKNLLQGSFLYIESELKEADQKASVAWLKILAAIQSELGYPIVLYQFSDFSNQKQMITLLRSGQIIEMIDENDDPVYYRQLENTDYIISLGPLANKNDAAYADEIIIVIYYLLVATTLFLWLWPFSQDLHELRKAAINFGEEDFKTRVNLRKKSSIAPVADAFNFMTQHIEELVVAHKDLTHAVSHELKTPLARFKFSLEIISSHDDATERHKYIQAMKEDVRELDDLIDEMLRYAKLSTENLKLNLEKIHANKWMQSIISQYDQENIKIHFQFLVASSETETETETEKEIIIDPYLMSRAVNNLIRNGLRYAKKQLKISLELINHQVKLRVDDDGLGIPEQDLEHIFQPFTRLDASRDRQSGGYGLGLAITRKIVEQHGGYIVADKSALGGAGFQLNWKAIDNLG
ncbi:MAG: ATP-binding protein [Methylococcaceae bacterium]|nr:ATP-binding protein [Methylococcaceae bacterium]